MIRRTGPDKTGPVRSAGDIPIVASLSNRAAVAPQARLPGTTGIWTFLFIDLLIFLAMFLVFVMERLRLPAVYAEGQVHLNGWLGLCNTLVLLTSSWFMALAVQASHRGAAQVARFRLLMVLLCGGLFCVGKAVEYGAKFRAGLGVATNSFYSFYYFMTGVHLLHVIGGMLFIAALRRRMKAPGSEPALTSVENIGLFWHVVDILWIYIFALVYLLGRS